MSFFGKLLGRKSAQEERARADALFERGEFGAAKLAYERARDAADGGVELGAELAERIDECRDRIAKARIEEAEALLAQGNQSIAIDELHAALQTAASPEIVREIEAKLERLECSDECAGCADAGAEPSDEDRFEIMAGSFEDDQYAEYLAHGPRMKEALLLLDDGKAEEARAILEALLSSADAPRYLYFELGRARLLANETVLAAEALQSFLSRLHPEERGNARLSAHMELAFLQHTAGNFEGAVAHCEAALEEFPHDPRPYLAMATFFRREGLPEEAIEVLEAGLSTLDEGRPDVRLWQELGLAHADAGHDAKACEFLERAMDYLVTRQHLDLPPEGAVRLAQLYEKTGRAGRALDLYTLLTKGSDRPNLCTYHVEAARLMQQLGFGKDARRMLERGCELTDDESVRGRIAEKLAILDRLDAPA